MFFLPFLSDLLLVDHDLVCSLLVTLVAFLRLEKTVFEMSDLDIALVIQLVDATLEHNLEAIDLGKCTLFFISELINELAESLVVIEVALVVTHIRVKFDFLLVLEDC